MLAAILCAALPVAWGLKDEVALLQYGMPSVVAHHAAEGNATVKEHTETELCQGSFRTGTLRVREGGRYTLKEDIVFDPRHPSATWLGIPLDSEEYPQRAGYFLGFFTAIAIEAPNVELDCKGHEIKMSKRFHKLQRFFSLIELGSSPFLKGQGPPQFGSPLMTPAEPVFAENVTIRNCRFGLSSHYSIHGNENLGVTLERLQMYDFEVGGVALNGATRVLMDGLTIGPSLRQTFPSDLSHANFMDHIANTLMAQQPDIAHHLFNTRVKLRGRTTTVAGVLSNLRNQLQEWMQTGGSPLAEVFGNGTSLPDGSAMYGLLLHRSGVATADFGFCHDCRDDVPCPHELLVGGVVLRNIDIRGLSMKVDQAVITKHNGSTVAGPAGDVFKTTKNWDPANCHAYVGNAISDAQIALGVLKKKVVSSGANCDAVKFFFGGAYIPEFIERWAAGDMSCDEWTGWVKKLTCHIKCEAQFVCTMDAMSHHNKGAVGMRLGFQEGISVKNVTIADLTNLGTENAAPYCVVADGTYQGMDVRGVSLAHMKDLKEFQVYEEEGSFISSNPDRVYPVIGLQRMRSDDAVVTAN